MTQSPCLSGSVCLTRSPVSPSPSVFTSVSVPVIHHYLLIYLFLYISFFFMTVFLSLYLSLFVFSFILFPLPLFLILPVSFFLLFVSLYLSISHLHVCAPPTHSFYLIVYLFHVSLYHPLSLFICISLSFSVCLSLCFFSLLLIGQP